MRLPSICLDDQLAKHLEQFRFCFSQPQYKYFVTILLGLLLCQNGFTLSGILRQVSQDVTLSGSSRFLSQAPWSTTEVCRQWQTAFQAEMIEVVEAEHARQRARQSKRRGRPRSTVVTEPALSAAEGLPHWRRQCDAKAAWQKDGRTRQPLFINSRENSSGSLSDASFVCPVRSPVCAGTANVPPTGYL